MGGLSMGAVTVSSSASRAALRGCASLPALRRRPSLSLALRARRAKCSAFVAPQVHATVPKDSAQKKSQRVKAVSLEAPPSSSSSSRGAPTVELDYNEVAAALENIYKLSPAEVWDAEEDGRGRRRRGRTRRKALEKGEEEKDGNLGGYLKNDGILGGVVRNGKKRARRLSLEKRITLRRRKEGAGEAVEESVEDVERPVREYLAATDLVSMDWKTMKIPPVLSSSEHNQLFKLMQPMKAIFEVKENMPKDLNREPTDSDLASAVNMSVPQIRRHIEVGQAARNKLIKHNLRLVLFVINKYYQEIASSQKFHDLCQAGAKGLITAIDKFEPKRGFRLSTYALFWIRHSITRSMTQSNFQRVSFGIESVRQDIQKAKLELSFELGRSPTEEEIIAKVGISPKRYHDVRKASKPVFSLNSRHNITQEEFINALTDLDGVGGDKHRQPALLRLALDDVLDSLKPKESLVIRQRYGLDGKGDRTLGEIAGNLNISREMVRKHELKAIMKLKHPARVDHLRRYV